MAGGKRIFFGYFTVAALVLTSFIPLSLGLSCAGIFYPAVSADLGIGTGLLGYYTSILWLAAMVTLPVMGRLRAHSPRPRGMIALRKHDGSARQLCDQCQAPA